MKKILVFMALFLILTACIEKGTNPGNGDQSPFSIPDLSGITAFRPDLRAREIETCGQAVRYSESCDVSVLPLIGMEHSTIDREAIMKRVAVSHEWMGTRFEEALDRMPPDLIQLFQSVTMIIIDSDVRPSFFWTMTGAIYLDPRYLWLGNEEKGTISQDPDERSKYGSDVPYFFAWRYVKNENYVYKNYSLTGQETRELGDIILPLTRLLYHELAHANDFFPPDQFKNFVGSKQKIVDVASALSNHRLSNKLPKLGSGDLISLARVFFRGEAASDQHKNANVGQLGHTFQHDGALDFYSYHTQFEYFAMIVESMMMKHHHGIDMEVGILHRPSNENPACDDYLVGWGSRNRIADSEVKPRAETVAREIFPNLNLTQFFNGAVGEESSMRTNEGWCSNLLRTPVKTSSEEPITTRRAVDPVVSRDFRQDFLSPEY